MSTPSCRVGDIAEQVRGVTYYKEESSSEPAEGLVPILRAGNITEVGLDLDDLVYVPRERVAAKQLLRQHDVLIATSSGSLSIVGKAAAARADLDVGFGAFCKVLRPSPAVHPRYFAHFFRTPAYRSRIAHAAAGANINNLRSADLDDLEIPLPRIEEQQRIAAILDHADELQTKRRQSLTLLEDLTESIFLERTHSCSATRPLSEGLSFITSGARGWAKYYAEHGTRFLRSLDVRMGSIADDSAVFVAAPDTAEARRIRVKERDVLLTITGSRIGRASMVPREADGAFISQHVATLRFDDAILVPEYVSVFLTSPSGQQQIASTQYGQTKPGLNFEQIRSFSIPALPIEEQLRVVEALRTVQSIQVPTKVARDGMETLFASLQDRAFSAAL